MRGSGAIQGPVSPAAIHINPFGIGRTDSIPQLPSTPVKTKEINKLIDLYTNNDQYILFLPGPHSKYSWRTQY
jgi:hypothetical protein